MLKLWRLRLIHRQERHYMRLRGIVTSISNNCLLKQTLLFVYYERQKILCLFQTKGQGMNPSMEDEGK